jgi:predicted RNA polymerase sigma factor
MQSAEHGAPPTTDHGDFRIPSRIPGRLEAVLDAIDAAFAEGWSDPGGIDIARRDLSVAAMFLGRLVTELMPQEAKALGRLGLMLHPQARRRARRNGHGECVPPSEQDASLWDSQMIDEAEGLLRAPVR